MSDWSILVILNLPKYQLLTGQSLVIFAYWLLETTIACEVSSPIYTMIEVRIGRMAGLERIESMSGNLIFIALSR